MFYFVCETVSSLPLRPTATVGAPHTLLSPPSLATARPPAPVAMVFGVSYHVAGRADCPYFARAERLAQMVQQTLQLHEREIQIEPIVRHDNSSKADVE